MKQKTVRFWTDAELKRMELYAKSGMTSKQAATKLKRGHPATRYKAMTEGISFKSAVMREKVL
jgi:hypothetical protein